MSENEMESSGAGPANGSGLSYEYREARTDVRYCFQSRVLVLGVFEWTARPFCSAGLSLCSRPEDLSEMLAAGTKAVHEKAESTQFVRDFLRGRIRKELFKVRFQSSSPLLPV